MNYKILINLILLTGILSSCNKWLEVQPESEIAAPVLFSTENGFMEAISGIYNRSNTAELYGKELTFGTTEVLAQNYSMRVDEHKYRQTSLYDYTNKEFIERKDKIWAGLYASIVNCNLILTNIDEKRNIFSGINYEIVKGEALALRAYLHFDLLRLFAPSYLVGPTAQGIPYATKYSKDPTPMSTVSETLELITKDLEEAKNLLKVDPIRSAGYKVGYPTVKDTTMNTEERSPILFLQNRRHHLNYYAVCGTLARVYIYKDDKAKALLNAKEVIDSKKIPFTVKTDWEAFDQDKKDRILYKELVFGWYMPGMAKKIQDDRWFAKGTQGLHLIQDAGDYIYERQTVGAEDYRLKYFLTSSSEIGSGIFYEIEKYRRNPLNELATANLHYLMAPALRLSELYYIAAEASFPTNPTQAYDYLNTVRTQRQIDTKLAVGNQEEFMRELIKDARKDLFAEGQLFYMYKRLNRGIVGQTGSLIPASNKIFVFPLPNDEIAYGGR